MNLLDSIEHIQFPILISICANTEVNLSQVFIHFESLSDTYAILLSSLFHS